MNDVLKALADYGYSIVIVAYLIWRDIKFMTRLDNTLAVIENILRKEKENEN